MAQFLQKITRPASFLLRQSQHQQSQQQRNYETLSVKQIGKYVSHVELNRPEKLNAMNSVFWR
jgi:hypothetical protein